MWRNNLREEKKNYHKIIVEVFIEITVFVETERSP